MVTDDSCRNLNSKQMATVMTLSSKFDNELNMFSCLFPDDIQQYEWYSLNRTIQMLIKTNDIEFFNYQKNEINKRIHCLQSIDLFNYRILILVYKQNLDCFAAVFVNRFCENLP